MDQISFQGVLKSTEINLTKFRKKEANYHPTTMSDLLENGAREITKINSVQIQKEFNELDSIKLMVGR
mgnify:CR=1 FL=1